LAASNRSDEAFNERRVHLAVAIDFYQNIGTAFYGRAVTGHDSPADPSVDIMKYHPNPRVLIIFLNPFARHFWACIVNDDNM
jgi:hypothetical protein